MLVWRVSEGRTTHMTYVLRYNFTHLGWLELAENANVLGIGTLLEKILNSRRTLSQLCRFGFDVPAHINAGVGDRRPTGLAGTSWSGRGLRRCVLSIPL